MMSQSTKKNRIIVILGAGRTGTSLLTKILIEFGMEGSVQNRRAAEHNPDGIFEDDEIVTCHMEILSFLGSHAYLPLAKDFLDAKGINKFINRLRTIVLNNVSAAKSLWGFKDPRTPSLLPLWMRVFNTGKIIPIYVLTVRDPKSSVESMYRQYNDSPQIAELTWLYRTCEALYQTGGNCFIVHYEDWFTEKAPAVGEQLIQYTGLDEYVDEDTVVSDAVTTVVKPNLNRAVYSDYDVQNSYVLKLYSALQQCRGKQFDRQVLMDVVMECRKAMSDFSGWSMTAQHLFKQISRSRPRELHYNVEENNKYLLECKNLAVKNEHLRIRLSVQEKELSKARQELSKARQQLDNTAGNLEKAKQQIKCGERKVFNLETSTSFQIGQIFVNAIAKPGKNTILLPLYLLRTLLASRVVKK